MSENIRKPIPYLLAAVPLLALAVIAAWIAAGGFSGGNGFLDFIVEKQTAFHTAMKQSLSAIADGDGQSAGLALVVGAFLYGIFHAAGPGHGKVILSTYLLTQPEQMSRSVILAAASAFVQGLVAIFLIYGLFFLFDLVPRESKAMTVWSERLSYGLLGFIGLWLIWRALKGLWPAHEAEVHHHHHEHTHDHAHHHDHAHDHSHDHHVHDHHHEHHHHHGEVCSSCGHAHVLTPEQTSQATDIKTSIGIVLSIGLRPCSGALLVLVFARFAGIPLAGVFAVLAISAGTAITVATIAILAVKMRSLAMRWSSSSGIVIDNAAHLLALGGGAILVILAIGLWTASFETVTRGMGL